MAKIRYLFILFIVLTSACSTTKYLAPGQKLYTGGTVKIDDKNIKKSEAKELSTELEALLRPKPNGSILGLRVKLYIYEKTKTTKKSGLKHYLNTHLGEPPVLVSTVDLDKNSSILQNRLQNESYFLAQVTGDTIGKKKTAKAVYTAQTGPAYHYRKVEFPNNNDDLDTAVKGTSAQSLLKVGDKYNLDIIKNERIRIDARLKEEGFFYFSPDDLIMRYDSTVAGHQVDLFVKVKDATPDEARWIYSVRNIYVYPHYSLKDTSLKLDSAIKYRWYNVIDPKNEYKPYTFENTVLLHPNDIYNRTQHNNSLSRFIELGPFKFVKNRFEDVTPDSAKLDIYYFLTQQKKKSLQVDLVGRQTSANYEGAQINLSFKNRNLFKGAELLTVTLFGSTDVQFGKYNSGYNVYQVGLQPSISWPRFIWPFNFASNNAYIPRTVLTTGYTLINRTQLYTLNSFNVSYGYQWKPNVHKQEDLELLTVTFVDPENVTQLYKDSIEKTRNPALAHVINRQFTFGPSYSYTWTNTNESLRTNTLYYNSKISLSANLYGIITGADTLKGKVGKIFGTPFDQYIKLENEIRFFHKLTPNSKLAMRFMVDVGIPYGNSTVLPYSQQFFIGGSNSLRGFQAHSIGPGSYSIPEELTQGTNFLPDESGDIKIEGNIEYRPKLFSIVEGALFADAGNIWLMRSNPYQPGAAFGKNFLSQIAADAGAGLRFNLTVLILRLDVGFPIVEPNLPLGQRVVIDKIDFGSSTWRSQNLVYNLAIGYPF
ncbi:outer membrane protein assembly factor BamA [Mucilaginibacter frigoritolerans]|jgi:outer membrane protein insertion porin family|uniref:Outer membrane protein assembly factor BamA n=1 Tax=Mucilaginibacter frigoritolerans TaxID=652788 RepID=A0A562UFP2_9SPHI|nr:BamA/TamA family outer membrane protein [Mucilaginibacter frigoritolerans]TWJ04646.1 outer membrane protein assembly factor BamA [Mucilaginibacter frigoritolerans]